MFTVFKLIGAGFVKGAGFINRSYNTKRMTNVERDSFFVSPDIHNILIGSLLGDLHINRQRNSINSRLMFKQGKINEAYILHLYDLFKYYCGTGPKYSGNPHVKTGNINYSISFNTYSLPCFNNYYDLFYVDRVKRIPLNIGELLTPVGLAYWAMDDGCRLKNNFVLCTDSYSFSEVELLIKVLKDNFDLNCTYLVRNEDQYRIYIKSDSMAKFRSLVTPHFHCSMMYKLTT
jgi:hypothetical protein